MDVGRASRLGTRRKSRPLRRDKKVFRKTASQTRVENIMSAPMRGGIRL